MHPINRVWSFIRFLLSILWLVTNTYFDIPNSFQIPSDISKVEKNVIFWLNLNIKNQHFIFITLVYPVCCPMWFFVVDDAVSVWKNGIFCETPCFFPLKQMVIYSLHCKTTSALSMKSHLASHNFWKLSWGKIFCKRET